MVNQIYCSAVNPYVYMYIGMYSKYIDHVVDS